MELDTSEFDLPTFLSPGDDEMDTLLASLIDGGAPEFRDKLAGLIAAAYRAGAADSLQEDARQITQELGDIGDEETSLLCRRLWERGETYLNSNPEQITISTDG